MNNRNIETVVNHKSVLGEGPVWDDKGKRILWLDIVKGHIHQFTPATKLFKTFSIRQMVGCIAPAETGFVAALAGGFSFVDLDTEKVVHIHDPEKDLPGNRFNEGKCDPMGRLWAGTLPLSEDAAAGSLYTLHPDLSVEKKIERVSISNGIAWSLDHKTFYFIDSPTFTVASYQYEKTSGEILDRKIVITIDESEGAPDGMTIDDEGMLWIAHWGGWKVARWNPQTGEKLMEIELPVSQVTSCTFGGENFEDLYITSASIRLTEEQIQKEPLAGSLFVMKNCGYKGMAPFEFKKITM